MRDDLVEILKYWIAERQLIFARKLADKPKPWTTDPILQKYRFCNVRRENDTVTKWFAENWRSDTYVKERNFVPALMFGRTVNWPDTLAKVGFPYEWNPQRVLASLQKLKREGRKVWTGAYVVGNMGSTLPKDEFIVGNSTPWFTDPPKVYPTLRETHASLKNYRGMGDFMAAQVIADLKHTSLLHSAPDWDDWAILGPGSRRGLNRLLGHELDTKLHDAAALHELGSLREKIAFPFCLQDLQNCLCEFDKYMRVKNGEGKPRSSYPGV